MRRRRTNTYLALCHATQGLNELQPFLSSSGLFHLLQPPHDEFDNGLNGSLELAVLLG
jgi:hypothetical protein